MESIKNIMNSNILNNERILITGAQGMIGCQLVPYLKSLGYQILTPTSQELDITKKEYVHNYFENHEISSLINLAAYTAVDKAEVEQELCYKINTTGVENLFSIANARGIFFMQFSTDFVFDGTESKYIESSTPNPLSVYGKSKYEAEKIVNNKGAIIRISYPFGPLQEVKKDFVHSISNLLKNNVKFSMVTDSIITPSYIGDICINTAKVLEKKVKKIFHSVGSESITPYDFGCKIATQLHLDPKIIGKTTFEEFYNGKAKRPRNMRIQWSKEFEITKISDALKLIFCN